MRKRIMVLDISKRRSRKTSFKTLFSSLLNFCFPNENFLYFFHKVRLTCIFWNLSFPEYTTVNCTTKHELMQQMFEKLTCTNSYQINDGVIIIFTFFYPTFQSNFNVINEAVNFLMVERLYSLQSVEKFLKFGKK